MQKNLNKFNGKAFCYCGKVYVVKNTKIVNYKAVILTDAQSFVKTESELDAFIDDIEFVSLKKNDISAPKSIVDMAIIKSTPVKNNALQAEIISAESNSQKVSNKLMKMFDLISDSPTEETYKQAEAMVKISNSIVNIQTAQMKFLSLKE